MTSDNNFLISYWIFYIKIVHYSAPPAKNELPNFPTTSSLDFRGFLETRKSGNNCRFFSHLPLVCAGRGRLSVV